MTHRLRYHTLKKEKKKKKDMELFLMARSYDNDKKKSFDISKFENMHRDFHRNVLCAKNNC